MIWARTFSSRSTMAALGLAEGHLVGHLEDIAQRLGAFAIKPAHGQAELVDRLDDRVDLFGQDQPGQVQHGADADAGAEIGRAGGQIAQLGAESVIRASSPARNPAWSIAVQAWRSCSPGRSACIRR